MKWLFMGRVGCCLAAMFMVLSTTGGERFRNPAAEASVKAGIREVRKGLESGNGSGGAAVFFRVALKVAPESEEGATARVWLAGIELEKAQTNTDTNQVKRIVKSIRLELQKYFKPDDSSWQAKVFKLIEISALMLERDWEEFERAINAMLKDIRKYSEETDPNYREFFEVNGQKAGDIEAQLSFLRVIAFSVRGDLAKALQHAKEIKMRFPEWSEKNRVDGAIETLGRGESPFKL